MKGYVILIASVAALGGLLFGFDTAVVNGTLEHLTGFFQLTKVQLGLVVGATSIGCIPGAWIAGKMSDVYGRKKVMLLTALLYVVAALGSGLAGSFWSLVVFRLVGGIAIGLASTVAPIYISEIAPARTRGRLGMLQQLAIVTGILISFISNYLIAKYHPADDWRYMLGAAVVPSLVFFLLLLLVPESPRWLALMGKVEEARRIFGRVGSEQPVVKGDVQTASLQEVFAPRYRRVTVIGLVFAAVAQLTGINIIFYYSPLIFKESHAGGSALFQTLLTGIVNLVFTIVAFWMIDRVGRKKLLLTGSAIMAACMLALGVLFWTHQLDNYFVLGVIFLYIAGFACSWGAVLWVYVAEIFPNHIRGKATSVAVTGNWTANAIVSLTFPYMLDALKGGPTFIVYALLNAGMIWFVGRYIFETKGVPLEQIEDLYALNSVGVTPNLDLKTVEK
jgi:SP family arabinose:H+ symporter-like MFS transporter